MSDESHGHDREIMGEIMNLAERSCEMSGESRGHGREIMKETMNLAERELMGFTKEWHFL